MNAHDFFEMASGVSAIVIAIAACVALSQIFLLKSQLKIAKDDILIRSRREAVALAADRCERFAATVEILKPGFVGLLGPVTKYPTWNLVNVRVQESSIGDSDKAKDWVKQVCGTPKMGNALQILNTLEAFAIYFHSGAADEKTAFPVTSAVFCGYVECLFPILVSLRKGTENVHSGQFQNVVGLYERWAARRKSISVDEQTGGIDRGVVPAIGTT